MDHKSAKLLQCYEKRSVGGVNVYYGKVQVTMYVKYVKKIWKHTDVVFDKVCE